NNRSFSWDGTAPTFDVDANGGYRGNGKTQAWAWTNSSGGGKVTCSTSGSGASVAGNVTVASSPVSNGGLAHPSADAACSGGSTNFAKHKVVSSTWQFGMTPAAMGSLDAGEYKFTIAYTATSL
ncbi:MAG: hypothetical protein ACRDAM_11130, partial [Casimicrobium sp.]